MEVNSDHLRSSISKLPDSELLRMATIDSSEYRPDALEFARQELARRNVSLPEPGQAAPLPRSTKRNPFAGLSILTRLLLAASLGYAAIVQVRRFADSPVHVNPGWGLTTVSALLWSIAWDARIKSREPVAGVPQEPKWPLKLVIYALLFTAGTVYAFVRGSLW